MAANTYVVRLVDIDKKTNYGVNGDANDVRNLLTTWYTLICQKASSDNATWTADVQWLDNPPATKPPDNNAGAPFVINMMIYFVLTPRDSVISLYPSNNGKLPDPGAFSDKNDIGLTWFQGNNSGVTIDISEVYVTRCRTLQGSESMPLVLARTAFHESMHNQLAVGNTMHPSGGFAGANPTGTSPTADNINRMAASIATLRPQWVDGFQAWKLNNESIH
jgi:hypothetical protein